MIILGIDPGTRFCGYGIINTNNRIILEAGCDCIKLNIKNKLSMRLAELYQQLTSVINEYKPDLIVVETVFYGKNIQSAITLSHARGVILLACASNNIPVFEYSPREIKKAITGNGNANKKQVRAMIQHVIGLKSMIDSEDASDALAIAFTHFNKLKFNSKLSMEITNAKQT